MLEPTDARRLLGRRPLVVPFWGRRREYTHKTIVETMSYDEVDVSEQQSAGGSHRRAAPGGRARTEARTAAGQLSRGVLGEVPRSRGLPDHPQGRGPGERPPSRPRHPVAGPRQGPRAAGAASSRRAGDRARPSADAARRRSRQAIVNEDEHGCWSSTSPPASPSTAAAA